jgi:hypothetical protein
MAASWRSVTLLCQDRGDRGIVEALSREFKQAGLHFGAPGERRYGMHPGFNLQLGDFATSPDNTDCDPVTRDAMQDHFFNKGTQQSLLVLAIDFRSLPDFR